MSNINQEIMGMLEDGELFEAIEVYGNDAINKALKEYYEIFFK